MSERCGQRNNDVKLRSCEHVNAPAPEDGKDRFDQRWIDAKKDKDQDGNKSRARLEDAVLFLDLLLVPHPLLPGLEFRGAAAVADANLLHWGSPWGSRRSHRLVYSFAHQHGADEHCSNDDSEKGREHVDEEAPVDL